MRPYFDWIGDITGDFGDGRIVQHISGRVRGDVAFPAAANSMFSGLTADGAAEAAWDIAWETYVDNRSPLFGSRCVNFLHDEFLCETHPGGAGAEAAERLSEVMIEAMERYITCVPVLTDTAMMHRWSKAAKTVRDGHGMLIPWKPKRIRA